MQLLQIDTEGLAVTIVTILFTLSLISERVSNLIKLCFESLSVRRYQPSLEKQRERNILLLALVSGLLVAFIAGADLFVLVNECRLLRSAEFSGQNVPGIILTGFFVSLGSKFWHDVLD